VGEGRSLLFDLLMSGRFQSWDGYTCYCVILAAIVKCVLSFLLIAGLASSPSVRNFNFALSVVMPHNLACRRLE